MNLFDISKLKEELLNLEEKTNDVNFWQDSKNSSSILKQINELKVKVESYKKVENNLENIIEMNNILQEENEESIEIELINSIKQIEKEIENIEINTLLSGKYDINNAILTLHPGARWNRKL